MELTVVRCSSKRKRPACLTLLPARHREEIDVYRAAKSCPFDHTCLLATLRSSAQCCRQRACDSIPPMGGSSSGAAAWRTPRIAQTHSHEGVHSRPGQV